MPKRRQTGQTARPQAAASPAIITTERTEPTNEDGATLPEKNLISVAQTGTDSYRTEVSARRA
jgi:hypothetical protein